MPSTDTAVHGGGGPPPKILSALLHEGEHVLWWAQPIRPPSGRASLVVSAIGALFVVAAVGAIAQIASEARAGRELAAAALSPFALVFLAFSLFALAFPVVVRRRLRRTYCAVTTDRVLHVIDSRRAPIVKEWGVAACDDANVARRRGASASLVLVERLRERKTDGRMIYEWEALHGIPDADRALAALIGARARRRT